MKTTTIKAAATIPILTLAAALAGCATSAPEKPVSDLAGEVRPGMTEAQVAGAAGQPKSRSVDGGAEVWQYRQTAKAYQGQKKALDILSFGMGTMAEAQMQDVLNVTFTNGVVSKVGYQENVSSAPFQGH